MPTSTTPHLASPWGYYQAGQSCISVQRVFVQSEVYEDFISRLVKQVESLKVGDPLDPSVDVGPVIDRASAERIEQWVREAIDGGARALTGGTQEGSVIQPTILVETKPDMKVCREE